mmetsp:Transcript_5065/g.9007  ORF Transcript_5065/g.9007 Transcript_5065/m.9007 type:complete len:309 (-) Transcript_5065:1351-2277(-)
MRPTISGDELSSRRVIGVVSREIDPLGVTELVAHEVEVTFASKCRSDRSDHLVQGYATVHDVVVHVHFHSIVHFRIHEPESDGLVSNQGLVMGLGIADARLAIPPVGQGVANVTHAPELVRACFHNINPLVGNGHIEPVVKAHSALLHWPAERRHSRHVLANRDSVWKDAVDHVIRKHQVRHRIQVSLHSKVLVVVSSESHLQSMVVVHHARHPIEPEAVELVLVEPPPAIRKQKPKHLPVSVIEESAVPHPMITLLSRVEVLAVRSVEEIDAIVRVARSMRVHDVDQNEEAEPVRLVNHGFELLWGT